MLRIGCGAGIRQRAETAAAPTQSSRSRSASASPCRAPASSTGSRREKSIRFSPNDSADASSGAIELDHAAGLTQCGDLAVELPLHGLCNRR